MNAEERSAIDFLARSAEHYRAKGSMMDAAITIGVKAMIERVCNERDRAVLEMAEADIAQAEGLNAGLPEATKERSSSFPSRLRALTEWRDIETAPRDGTRILLAWGGKTVVGFYLDNSAKPMPWQGWRVPAMETWPNGVPTAWLPLPPPPVKK